VLAITPNSPSTKSTARIHAHPTLSEALMEAAAATMAERSIFERASRWARVGGLSLIRHACRSLLGRGYLSSFVASHGASWAREMNEPSTVR